ncbi:MAG: hypothetical protein AB1752_12410 [Candidatus Zixiibacteriota bacterium]
MLNLLVSLALFWPLLQATPPVAPYKALSKFWDPAGTVASGVSPVVAVATCPASQPDAGSLIVADSTGRVAELKHTGNGWTTVRTMRVDEPISALCTAAPHMDRVWRVYIGTKSGRVLELSRGELGWITVEIAKVTGPVMNMQGTDPGLAGVSQVFAVDAKGSVTNLWLTETDKWVTRPLPDVPGGTSEVCFDYGRDGVVAITSGSSGVIHKWLQDSTGHWKGTPWATMPAGALDMAASADPTMKDIAVYYSGQDGLFRYLFFGRTTDEDARIPVAGGSTLVIGKGPQRRFNEFFAMSGEDFCLFEFNFSSREWDKVILKTIPSKVVSTAFGPGRGEQMSQVYAVSVDGTVYEFTRRDEEAEGESRK